MCQVRVPGGPGGRSNRGPFPQLLPLPPPSQHWSPSEPLYSFHPANCSTASEMPGRCNPPPRALSPGKPAQFKGHKQLPTWTLGRSRTTLPRILVASQRGNVVCARGGSAPQEAAARERGGQRGRGLPGGGRAVCGERGWRAGRAARRRRHPPARRRRLRSRISAGPASRRRSLSALRFGRRLRADAGPGRRRG